MKNTNKSRFLKDQITVADAIESLMPSWNFPHDWFAWPPDTFLMTSIILKRTGCYRYVLSNESTTNLRKQPGLEASAIQWIQEIDSLLRDTDKPIPSNFLYNNKILKNLLKELQDLSTKVDIYELKTIKSDNAKKLCKVLINIHAIADEACSGFGLLNSSSEKVAMVHYLANLFLISRGTLSAISKYHGIVIPKLRTPQSGLSLRSFSHHVTYHSTEVEVIWRTIPWDNIEENTINILAVPCPYKVEEQNFSFGNESFEPVRYFDYNSEEETHKILDDVICLLRKIDQQVGRVHIVVFPELALSEDDYTYLLKKLRNERMNKSIAHVPMIIAGVRSGSKKVKEFNQVRLAAYFASRWYDLSQHKHHRWKLNRTQIRQYSLEGRLSTSRELYENIVIDQRRLTFLVPNGWLALCPLICEDLAQLEPVSEVIRGVGPTLLVALLFDGPQMKERWSARYASVFADDPGTAVLTLTSAGMAKRSKDLSKDKQDPDNGINRLIALWKDQVIGWSTLELAKDEEVLFMTISADWVEEYTADGRSDHQNAAVFKIEGTRQYALQNGVLNKENKDKKSFKGKWRGDWLDIKELSAATFALDTIIKLRGRDKETILSWLSND